MGLTANIYIDNSNLLNMLKETTENKEEGGITIDYGKLCVRIMEELHIKTGLLFFEKDEGDKHFFIGQINLENVYLYDGLPMNIHKRRQKESFIDAIKNRISKIIVGVPHPYDLSYNKDEYAKAIEKAYKIAEENRRVSTNGIFDVFLKILEQFPLKHPKFHNTMVKISSKGLADRDDIYLVKDVLESTANFNIIVTGDSDMLPLIQEQLEEFEKAKERHEKIKREKQNYFSFFTDEVDIFYRLEDPFGIYSEYHFILFVIISELKGYSNQILSLPEDFLLKIPLQSIVK